MRCVTDANTVHTDLYDYKYVTLMYLVSILYDLKYFMWNGGVIIIIMCLYC